MGQGESKTDVFLRSIKIAAAVDLATANKIWDEFDTNRNGRLDKAEAGKFVAAWCKANNVAEVETTQLEFFKLFDSNKDGSISKEEIMGQQVAGWAVEEKVAAGGKKGVGPVDRRPFLPGKWLSREYVNAYLKFLRAKAELPLAPPIINLDVMVRNDPMLYSNAELMFTSTSQPTDPLDEPTVRCWGEFIVLLNKIMATAPLAYQQTAQDGTLSPAGLIGFPINALLDYPMATPAGLAFWGNQLVNQLFKKILGYWAKYLVTEPSRYVLVEGQSPQQGAFAIPWLSSAAQLEMVQAAQAAVPNDKNPTPGTFAEVFQCNPNDPQYYGFTSWDNFFTRVFVAGVRPIEEPQNNDVVVNGCESAPFALSHNVKLSDQFYLKGQAYSVEDMLGFDELAPQFANGTVYQAFLSALSYHRWNSPVSGTIVKQYVINGTYYLETVSQGDSNPNPDPSAPNNSQGFLTAVATRALIFIQADNPKIGLMCMIAIGMAEVSSCDTTVKEGQHVNKGDQLGMFHFGGSTHCLLFRPQTNLKWDLHGLQPGPSQDTNIRMGARIATVL